MRFLRVQSILSTPDIFFYLTVTCDEKQAEHSTEISGAAFMIPDSLPLSTEVKFLTNSWIALSN